MLVHTSIQNGSSNGSEVSPGEEKVGEAIIQCNKIDRDKREGMTGDAERTPKVGIETEGKQEETTASIFACQGSSLTCSCHRSRPQLPFPRTVEGARRMCRNGWKRRHERCTNRERERESNRAGNEISRKVHTGRPNFSVGPQGDREKFLRETTERQIDSDNESREKTRRRQMVKRLVRRGFWGRDVGYRIWRGIERR